MISISTFLFYFKIFTIWPIGIFLIQRQEKRMASVCHPASPAFYKRCSTLCFNAKVTNSLLL